MALPFPRIVDMATSTARKHLERLLTAGSLGEGRGRSRGRSLHDIVVDGMEELQRGVEARKDSIASLTGIPSPALPLFHQRNGSSGGEEKEIPFVVPSLGGGFLSERARSEHDLNNHGLMMRSLQPLPDAETTIPFTIPNSATFPDLTATRHLRMFCSFGLSNSSLGSLNPELYKSPEEGDITDYPDGHIGRLWLSVDYDKESEKLVVGVGKARNLPPRTPGSAALDPFVRVFLLPDERRHVQTKTKRKSLNPNFNETFTFEVAKESFEDRILKLVVMDVDPLQRHIPVGSVVYALRDYVGCKQQKLVTWLDVKRDSEAGDACERGELLLGLSFNAGLERLGVTVLEAKDLRPLDASDSLDSFVRVALSIGTKAQGKPKKTKVVKATLEPNFGEPFNFKLPPGKLGEAIVSIQLMQAKPERQLGRVTLAGDAFSRGKSLEHWNAMLENENDLVQDWHYLTL